MSVLMVMEIPGGTTAEYDRVNEIMGMHSDADEPDALLQHVAASDGSSLVVVDVWESEEEMGKFFQERLGAALAEAGVQQSGSKQRVLPVHNALTGKGADAGILMLIDIEDLGTDAYDQMVTSMEAHYGDGSQHPSTSHAAAVTEDGGMVIADLWESPEAFRKFAEEQIGPAGAAVGLGPIEPRILPVHHCFKKRAAQPAS
jgi:heme-degrading monooxygenase HmoA